MQRVSLIFLGHTIYGVLVSLIYDLLLYQKLQLLSRAVEEKINIQATNIFISHSDFTRKLFSALQCCFLQFSQRRCLFVDSCLCGRNFLRTLCLADLTSGLWSSSASLVVWRGRVQTAADKKVPGWRRVHSHFSATKTSETKTSDSAGRWRTLLHSGQKNCQQFVRNS